MNIVTTLSYICTGLLTQVHQHQINNVEMPISQDVDNVVIVTVQ